MFDWPQFWTLTFIPLHIFILIPGFTTYCLPGYQLHPEILTLPLFTKPPIKNINLSDTPPPPFMSNPPQNLGELNSLPP